MRSDNRTKREAEIAAAAYAVITERGYAGASMLTIARRAKASNETLYNWYGDKLGLMRALIQRNSDEIRQLLESAVREDAPPLSTLETLAPALLRMLLSDQAIALNRAAAADSSGALGQALAEAGRATIAPLIGQIIRAAKQDGMLEFEDLDQALQTYISLLVGDLQIRSVTGAMLPYEEGQITDHASLAMTQFYRLYGVRS